MVLFLVCKWKSCTVRKIKRRKQITPPAAEFKRKKKQKHTTKKTQQVDGNVDKIKEGESTQNSAGCWDSSVLRG